MRDGRLAAALVLSGRSEQAMGLEQAELRLFEALRAAPGDVEIGLRVVGGRSARRHAARLGARWYPARPGRAPRRAWRGADVVHLVGLTVRPPPEGTPFVATFHDLSPLHFPDEGSLPPWVPDVARRAERVLCPSSFTASELERHLRVPRERIRVVPNGPGHDVSPATPPLADDELARLGLKRPFVLRLGGYTRRKNLSLLLSAWRDVRARHGIQLALVGPRQAARERELNAAPSLEGVVVLDYLPPKLVPRLLRSASALVTTSLYEGFGLPPLEAMAAGTPVVAVRRPFVEEVCDRAAVLVDEDGGAVADGLSRVLEDAELRRRLRSAGLTRAGLFTWERSARAHLDVYREAPRSRAC